MKLRIRILIIVWVAFVQVAVSQNRGITWTPDGMAYVRAKDGGLVRVDPKTDAETFIIKKEQLVPPGSSTPLKLQSFDYSPDK